MGVSALLLAIGLGLAALWQVHEAFLSTGLVLAIVGILGLFYGFVAVSEVGKAEIQKLKRQE